MLNEFYKHFIEHQNEIFASFKFLEMKDEQGEKFAGYYSRLLCAVVECNYDESQDCKLHQKIMQSLINHLKRKRNYIR